MRRWWVSLVLVRGEQEAPVTAGMDDKRLAFSNATEGKRVKVTFHTPQDVDFSSHAGRRPRISRF